jgi:hypothetical protein
LPVDQVAVVDLEEVVAQEPLAKEVRVEMRRAESLDLEAVVEVQVGWEVMQVETEETE